MDTDPTVVSRGASQVKSSTYLSGTYLSCLENRYVGDGMQIYAAFSFVRHIVMHTTQNCSLITMFLGYLYGAVMSSMQGIMIYRISSMYNNERRVMVLLFTALTLEWVWVMAISFVLFEVKVPVQSPAPGVHLCSQDSFPDWMYTIWIPSACFELLILALSLSPALKYYQSIRGIRPHLESLPLALRPNSDSLAYILLRDSITFPFISLAICIANLFIFKHLPYLAAEMGLCVAFFAPCILGSRLIINLREAYYQPFLHECKVPNVPDEGNESAESSPDDFNMDSISDILRHG